MSNHQAKSWIDLGEWGTGMDEYKLPSSNDLAGKEITVRFNDDNHMVNYKFLSSNSLERIDYESSGSKHTENETYEAICIASDIYFVDFVKKPISNISVSMALDFSNRIATEITARTPDIKHIQFSLLERLRKDVDLSLVQVEIKHAMIGPFLHGQPASAHERTRDLIGKRIKYTYGRNRVYEHIYLNERFYTWHCLTGAEAGLGDTDYCDYLKVAPDIYLFCWREKIMPTFGLVLINLKEMRSNGKTFGLDIASGKYLNFTMGALAEFLNETRY
jgi:hypothetical protein